MKYLRGLLILAGMLVLFAFAGCARFETIQVDTTMTVDQRFDGSRVMSANIPYSIYKKYFDGNIDNLKNTISSYAPEEMYCTASANSSGGALVEIHIDFGSLKEYQKKISNICADNKSADAITPSVDFDYSRSILKNGYTIKENFNSLDLLYWLKDGIAREYSSVSEEDTSGMFSNGAVRLILNGQEIDLGDAGRIESSNIESHTFDTVKVTAQLNEDESVDAQVDYTVSKNTAAALGAKLEELMNSVIPKGGTMSYSDGDTSRTYKLKFSSATIQVYIAAMNKALRCNNTVFKVSTEGDADSMSARKTITQYYDAGYFLDFTDDKAYMTYVLRLPSNYTVNECTSSFGYLDNYDTVYSNDQCEVSMAVRSPDEVTDVMGFVVDIDSIHISTQIQSEVSLTRTIKMKLGSDVVNLLENGLQKRIEKTVEKYPDNLSVSSEDLAGAKEYTLTIKAASFDDMTKYTRAILGEDMDADEEQIVSSDGTVSQSESSRLSGGIQARKNPFKIHMKAEDTLNLSRFLQGSVVTEGISYELIYPKYYKAAFTENTSFDDAVAEGQKISCSTHNKIISVKSEAVSWNLEGIIVFLMWAASLVCVLVIFILDFPTIIHYLKDKKLDIEGESLFRGKNLAKITMLVSGLSCLVIMSARLLFRIY